MEKSEKQKLLYSEYLLRLDVFCVVLCVCFCTGPFCHGGLKLALSTLFTTFFSLNISSIYNIINALNDCPSCHQFSDTLHRWALGFTHLMLVL